MARLWVHASDERIETGAGTVGTFTAMSWAAIWFPTDATTAQGLLRGDLVGTGKSWGVNPYSDGLMYWGAGGGFTGCQAYTGAEWQFYGISKPGGNSAVRSHKYLYNSTTWAHVNQGNVPDPSTTADLLYHGRETSSETLKGDLAVQAVWKRELSDADNLLLPFSLQAWVNSAPDALWIYNQTDTSQTLSDTMGNGANQSAISGTAVSTNPLPSALAVDYPAVTATAGPQMRYAMLRDWRLVYG